MNFKKALTPKDVEEVKPGLFIQKKGDKYRQIKPLVWKGEWNLKNQFGWGNLLWIIIIGFLVWSYFHDVGAYKDFYETVISNPVSFCANVSDYTRGVLNEGINPLSNNFEPST